jgi:hypothetical protein
VWRLDVSFEAELEIFEAALRYERERDGLGFRFEVQVNTVFARLLENPLQFPVIEADVRRALTIWKDRPRLAEMRGLLCWLIEGSQSRAAYKEVGHDGVYSHRRVRSACCIGDGGGLISRRSHASPPAVGAGSTDHRADVPENPRHYNAIDDFGLEFALLE